MPLTLFSKLFSVLVDRLFQQLLLYLLHLLQLMKLLKTTASVVAYHSFDGTQNPNFFSNTPWSFNSTKVYGENSATTITGVSLKVAPSSYYKSNGNDFIAGCVPKPKYATLTASPEVQDVTVTAQPTRVIWSTTTIAN